MPPAAPTPKRQRAGFTAYDRICQCPCPDLRFRLLAANAHTVYAHRSDDLKRALAELSAALLTEDPRELNRVRARRLHTGPS